MTTEKKIAITIDEYMAGFPKDVQQIMQTIRATIVKAAPEAEEKISYAMPTFTIDKDYLVYFAGFKNHIGFYPAPIGVAAFEKELAAYKTGKGSVQFPLNKPMPLKLIGKIVAYRLKQHATKAGKKK